jgi:hypothetical protein
MAPRSELHEVLVGPKRTTGLEGVVMSGSDRFEDGGAGQRQDMEVRGGKRDMLLDDLLRARSEGAFVSPCGTEGCRWEGFPEWPEEFPYDAFMDGSAEMDEKEDET